MRIGCQYHEHEHVPYLSSELVANIWVPWTNGPFGSVWIANGDVKSDAVILY